MDSIDSARYPRVAAYVAALPQGLQSHPGCKASAALYRDVLTFYGVQELDPGLPAALAEPAKRKLPVSSWIEEARSSALILAVADHLRLSDDEFLARDLEFNKQFLGGKFFRVLMSVTSPNLLLTGASFRWDAVHQGSTIEVARQGKEGARVTLTLPERLFSRLNLRCYGGAFRALLQMSNVKAAAVELTEETATQAVYKTTWS